MSQTSEGAPPRTAPKAGRLAVVVIKETAAGERRVALVPGAVARLADSGIDVLVESGAGSASCFSDEDYTKAGATIVSTAEAVSRAEVILTVGTLPPERVERLVAGQVVIGMLRPLVDPHPAYQMAAAGVTAISLDGLPRTLGRAQSMDALSSQANVAGYKAALVAANSYGKLFPLLITAAGTAKPADVLVLGAGVAGLQAMGTAHRLGAVVTGYDVRPETGEQIRSVGARVLELRTVASEARDDGYAQALSESEQAAQQEDLNDHISHFDVVITTAKVPGRRPPLLVTDTAIKRMRPGSVLIDLGASDLGGNVEGSLPDETVVTDNAVTIVGAGNLASEVPTAASAAYSHNISALLGALVHDGALVIDLDDEIQAGVVVTFEGRVVHRAVAELLEVATGAGVTA